MEYKHKDVRVSMVSNPPDMALAHLCDLVCPPGVTDSYRLQFELSTMAWWVRLGVGSSVIDGRWCGHLRSSEK